MFKFYNEEEVQLRQAEILSHASSKGLEEEVISYANQIQRTLGMHGDVCEWIDALEMAYEEIILQKNW